MKSWNLISSVIGWPSLSQYLIGWWRHLDKINLNTLFSVVRLMNFRKFPRTWKLSGTASVPSRKNCKTNLKSSPSLSMKYEFVFMSNTVASRPVKRSKIFEPGTAVNVESDVVNCFPPTSICTGAWSRDGAGEYGRPLTRLGSSLGFFLNRTF